MFNFLMKLKQAKKSEKGFTLIEMVIAAVLVLMAGAVVAPMLLSYVEDSKVASINEQMMNTRAAFDAYYTSNLGSVSAATKDAFFDEVVAGGFMARVPVSEGIEWTIVNDLDLPTGLDAFYLKGKIADGATAGTPDQRIINRIAKLDEKMDGNSGAADGILQWDAAKGELFYLLYGANIGDLADGNWYTVSP